MNTEKHSICVETEIVASPDGKSTYEVIKRLKGTEGGKAIIVLLYPTRTKDNIFAEDSTLNHLVGHMPELGINELRILNLFSTVVDGKLSASGLKVDVENMAYICSTMTAPSFKDTKFIIAWGTSMATSYACQASKAEVLRQYKKVLPKGKPYQLMSSNTDIRSVFAPHPLFLGIRAGRSLWSVAEVHITSEMTKEPTKKCCSDTDRK